MGFALLYTAIGLYKYLLFQFFLYMDSRKLNDMMLENEEEEEDQEMNSLAESEAEEPIDV